MLPNLLPPVPPIVTPPITIPPADWEAEAAERGDASETSDELPALAAIKGYDPEPWRPIAPPHEPLLPVQLPPPDWREEERLRSLAEREEHALAEEHPGRHPPPRREPA